MESSPQTLQERFDEKFSEGATASNLKNETKEAEQSERNSDSDVSAISDLTMDELQWINSSGKVIFY